MSTSFDVIPGRLDVPTFRNIFDLVNIRLNQYLESISKKTMYNICFEIRDQKNHNKSEGYNFGDRARWDQSEYLWLFVKGKEGGAEGYCWQIEDEENEFWEQEILSNSKAKNLSDKILLCLSSGFYWNISREGTNDPIIDVIYGYVAAALAELTEGILFSNDNAWDDEYFPATADEFYSWYFRPEKARSKVLKEWCEASISMLEPKKSNTRI